MSAGPNNTKSHPTTKAEQYPPPAAISNNLTHSVEELEDAITNIQPAMNRTDKKVALYTILSRDENRQLMQLARQYITRFT